VSQTQGSVGIKALSTGGMIDRDSAGIPQEIR
jgi:hypothetical protein